MNLQVRNDPESVQPGPNTHPVDVIGNFAINSWQAHEAGDLSDKNTVKAAIRLVGMLSSHAATRDIKPPEAAILELTEEAEVAARDLLEAGLHATAELKKPTHPDNVKRIKRFISHDA